VCEVLADEFGLKSFTGENAAPCKAVPNRDCVSAANTPCHRSSLSPTYTPVLPPPAAESTDGGGVYATSGHTAGGGEKYPILYLPECRPPEVVAAEAEEAALAAEADARRQAEAEALRAARAAEAEAAAASKAKAPRGSSGRGRGGAAGSASATAAAKQVLAAQAVALVPMFPRRDKRSMAEIQEELKAKRAKTSSGGSSGVLVPSAAETTSTSGADGPASAGGDAGGSPGS
jgi:hypothetical protein